jgi:predicted permease
MRIFLERIWQDLYHGTRTLANAPAFTLTAVLSLAIGIGANTAMYSWADALLLRPLTVERPGDVVDLGTKISVEGFSSLINSYPDYRDLRDHTRSFQNLVAYNSITVGFTPKPDSLPQMKYGYAVSGNFLEALGVAPELGRAFRPEEDQAPGRDAVVVLDHGIWEQLFAADKSILGKKVRLNGIDFTVIGVSPERFAGMDQFVRPSFFVPIMMYPALSANPKVLDTRDARNFTVKGYLKPGVTMAQAQSELTAFAQDLERLHPETNKNQNMVIRTEFQARVDQDPIDAQLIAMLLTLSGAVLLVACANVASLLTSRAPARAKEMALRLAIGAGRSRLVRQLITESMLIALVGGALGIAVGYGGILLFQQVKVPSDVPIELPFTLNPRVLYFTMAVAISSVFLFGLIPALKTARADLAVAMKTGDAATAGRPRVWGRSFLVGGQVAAALVLLTVSAFMYRGFQRTLASGQGFRTDHLLMMSFDPSLVHYDVPKTEQFYKQLLERSRAVSGVKSVALASAIPMSNQGDAAVVAPEGFQFPKGKENVVVFASRVDENYFDTMAISILRGRGFRETDSAGKPKVAVVNEQFAGHYWPGQDAIGKRFQIFDQDKNSQNTKDWVEIVGIAKTGKYLWVAEPPTEFIYLPWRQNHRNRLVLLAESMGDPSALAAPLREVVQGLDRDQPVLGVRTMEEFYKMRVITTSTVIVETVGGMGLMGLVLATIGLYSLGAYAVSRRTREIGIRMAVGAAQSSVLLMTLRRSLVPALWGLAAGLAASYFAEKLMRTVFPAHTNVDLAAYFLVVPALLAITALAAYIPARRASQVDPLVALRYE